MGIQYKHESIIIKPCRVNTVRTLHFEPKTPQQPETSCIMTKSFSGMNYHWIRLAMYDDDKCFIITSVAWVHPIRCEHISITGRVLWQRHQSMRSTSDHTNLLPNLRRHRKTLLLRLVQYSFRHIRFLMQSGTQKVFAGLFQGESCYGVI